MMNRRDLLKLSAALGAGQFFNVNASTSASTFNSAPGVMDSVHHTAKAKRVIYLYMAGGPSQFETFDHKPEMKKWHGQDLPPSILGDQRLTGMSANQSSLPVAASPFGFKRCGESGMEISDLLPHTQKIADDIALVKTVYSEAINHGPANTFMQTGSQLAGRPSIGAWLNYALGTDNINLPPFVVMRTKNKKGQKLFSRLWGNGFLPAEYQGVLFRPDNEPVAFLNNPGGIADSARRRVLDHMKRLEEFNKQGIYDPQIDSRLHQYDMAYRMQHSIPEAIIPDVADLRSESEATFNLYGEDSKIPGTFANNCLQARRLVERGVKFVQLYHQGWDSHGGTPSNAQKQCKETDQGAAGLIQDLKQRGLLDDTLVIWGGEFGRTAYSQGKITEKSYGRDHHPRCFPMWMAGGGIKGGVTLGETDDFSYNIASDDKMHIHDFHATILHLLGINHERLTYKFQGRRFRLTDVHGHVMKKILT
ncbi:DUF1501 domain-containing protein [Thalassotalea crassostreae]|uniref:DUF1501 domain-containing protein n=1 Tax=Thalassotalea crassostreae TaxID=1763536 RepID=UPI0008397115|nr:DUF1501 domain-containing protein [Thalassotalea crassostreae]